MGSGLNLELWKKTPDVVLHLKVWVLVTIIMFLGIFILVVIWLLWWCCGARMMIKSRKRDGMQLPVTTHQIPSNVSREIRIVDHHHMNNSSSANYHIHHDNHHDMVLQAKCSEKDSDKLLVKDINSNGDDGMISDQSSCCIDKDVASINNNNKASSVTVVMSSRPLAGLAEIDWGHWFTLRDLQNATNSFSKANVIGEGGYGIVYRAQLINGTIVAVKRLLNNLGQAEKEFRVEVEAIGHVRHMNLVRLLGYCIEGTHRMLVYEYVNNGNLEQWLHGEMLHHGHLTWEGRMKILLGTAKALAYLHEAIEPKVVHRDIKASNILIDQDFNAKISDFGLAKLMGAGESHIITRVMGTFGYVAPEYASTGILNEKSDVFSFGVVLLEAITGRDPVDDSLPLHEKNLVEWLKMMVAAKRTQEVVDRNLDKRPSKTALKRALLTALRCVDPNAQQRPSMTQVVRMLDDSDDYPIPPRHARTPKS